MATIVTRAGKGSPLTHNEVDANFNNLNGDKLEASNNLSDLDDAATAVANLGITASASELNILDGATVTTAEINQLDGNGFTADVLPDADSTRDLGSSTKAWAEAHVDTVISTNVSDGTLSIPTTYVTNGSAKAWVNFNGTGTIAARDSFNVSSLTDNGTGDYTVNFSNDMANANYSFVGAGLYRIVTVSNSAAIISGKSGTAPATSSLRIVSAFANTSVDDYEVICASMNGDLA
jgi:hypothetical protein